jgi:hypothetical protein
VSCFAAISSVDVSDFAKEIAVAHDCSNMPSRNPTPFAELNSVLGEIVSVARRVLERNLVGVYLQGSFALGGGDLASDCDFVAVTRGPVTPDQEIALRAFHDELPTRDGFWNRHIEGSYAPANEIKTLAGLGRDWLYIDHGWREMQWSEHCNTAVVRWILHERGLTLYGLPVKDVVDALPEGVLRADMAREIPTFLPDLFGWISFEIAWAQRYAVESLCRMWFTFETDEVASKRDCINWALPQLDARWRPLLQNAIDDRQAYDAQQAPSEHFAEETLAFADLITAIVQNGSTAV